MKTNEQKNGGLSALMTIAYRNIWRNGRRTALCVTAIAIAVFFNIFMQAWMEGMIDGIEEVVRTYETGHVNIVAAGFERDKEYFPVQYPVADGRNAQELIDNIEKLPHVRAALPRITSYATLFDSTVKHALLWGIDVEKELKVNIFNLTDRDDGLKDGRYPKKGEAECAIGSILARKMGLKIGDKLPLKTVSAQFSDKYFNPTIVGVFEFDYRKYDEDVIIVPFDKLQKILVLGQGTQQLFVYADNASWSAAIKTDIGALVGKGNFVREWRDNYWVAMLQQSTFLYFIIFGVFQVVASFLIINTVLMVIHERIKEIGMMGALGMTRREIVSVFFFEAVYLSIFGALIGCAVGGAASYIGSLFPLDLEFFTGGGMKDMPISSTIFIKFSPGIVAGGFVFGVAVSAACTLIPSLKSAFIEPVEALRR
ncbi:MAG: ABC transporter permease [Treponemataceae bacterium]